MKKIFAKIHLWLSIPLSIVITIVCLSGAALVFESEITRAINPRIYRVKVPADAQPLAPSQLIARIGEQIPDSLHPVSLELPARSDEPCMAVFRQTGRKQLSIDPYTGDVNGWAESPAFFNTMRKLHRWLLDPPAIKGEKSVGKVIVGISTLALVLILISGLVLWIPRSRKALRNRLKVSVDNGRRRLWYDFHVSLGFYVSLPLLVMALTGLTWSFGWYRTAAYALFDGTQTTVAAKEHPSQRDNTVVHKRHEGGNTHHGEHKSADGQTKTKADTFDYAVWDKVLAQLTTHYPTYKAITLTQTEAQIRRQTAMRRADRVTFDSQSGRLGKIDRYEDTPRQQRLRSWFYAFHTGSWGGIWTKLLYFLAALIGATLPLTGCYLWWKRTYGRAKTK